MTATLADLVGALRSVPALPGAKCRGRAELFDGADGPDGARTRLAAAFCARCPALTACAAWAGRQPDNRLDGVVAGRLFAYVAHTSQRRFPNGVVIRPDPAAISTPTTEEIATS
jgi:hypothetical protein